MANNVELLAELNAFRIDRDLAPFADWRKARHMPLLETYRAERAAFDAAYVAGGKADDFEATPSYSSKSTALRGAKRAGMENAVAYESEGRWYISDASEVLGKADDFEATSEELAAQEGRPSVESDLIEVTKEKLDEMRATVEQVKTLVKATTEEAAPVAAPAAPEKMKSYKQVANYNKSSKESPVAYIHAFLSANPTLSRKAAVIALTSEHGINYSTARTQYQRWFSANKAAK
ncbi:hypothetical protein ACP46_gp45 [Rhizobium phage RHEph06]|uniref:Uncharacterized protein n=2 Tax=Kleczkowskavirus RHEph4 TaxID=1921526 RepID=L7TKY3_9CAUD|nr:hypothetical protein ACP46_gp45 [Rhizobium phage RHEph06]YP_009598486.1 hypothetical protein FDH25_gp44 [Rhizobium phage RHEph04]AGC35806.1 hypothetical protein RHEph05_gp039 [Rhizobium phage RHEph05]QXV74923.1 hypothetical protein [Rhizobium phage RHEph26]AGC35730.1 hypothetical protein RHEph04_gp044 [Rhizobium phage RHEph04]AGC35887.1 hypothetical protein RHEph06_gp045 [Rhizobium phage RHEph06]